MPGVPRGEYGHCTKVQATIWHHWHHPFNVTVVAVATVAPLDNLSADNRELGTITYIGTGYPFGTKLPPFGYYCTALGLGATKRGGTVPL